MLKKVKKHSKQIFLKIGNSVKKNAISQKRLTLEFRNTTIWKDMTFLV